MPNCQEFRLVTRADVAQMFGVCVKTVDNYIKEGLLPQPVQFASREYWHPDDMRSFMDATFKRSSPAPLPNAAAQATDAQMVPQASATRHGAQPNPPSPKSRDSHPTVRAKTRGHALLQRLNSTT
jgi:hypothetical protein